MCVTYGRSIHDVSQDMTKWCIRAASTIAVAGCMALGAAGPAAADWYLRAGIGLDRPAKTIFMDRDCSAAKPAPAALYSCGTGRDGAPYRSVGDFGTAMPLELGLGYTVTPASRLEVLVEYRPHFAFKGRANFLPPGRRQSVAADLSSSAVMLAYYIDLPRLGVPSLGPFGPFVGTGVGVVRTRIGQTRMTYPATTTIVPGASRTGLAWMVTAGVAAALDERVTVDLAWRYTDLGTVQTGRGAGRVIWRDGSKDPVPLDLDETRAKLAGHGLRLSLRYSF